MPGLIESGDVPKPDILPAAAEAAQPVVGQVPLSDEQIRESAEEGVARTERVATENQAARKAFGEQNDGNTTGFDDRAEAAARALGQ